MERSARSDQDDRSSGWESCENPQASRPERDAHQNHRVSVRARSAPAPLRAAELLPRARAGRVGGCVYKPIAVAPREAPNPVAWPARHLQGHKQDHGINSETM